MSQIGIWDAPPLEKTPEQLEEERRYKEAVQFGADYDRDPNRMLQKLEQQRRQKDVMGQIDPLTQQIIKAREDLYTPEPKPDMTVGPPDEAPAGSPPATPRPMGGPRRPLRTIQNLGGEGPTVRANTPGLAQIEGRAAVNPGGAYEQQDAEVIDRQMAQAEQSNAMRAKVAEQMAAQRAANPAKQRPERWKTTVGPQGIGGAMFQDGNIVRPQADPMAGISGRGASNVLAAMIRAKAQADSNQTKRELGTTREENLNNRQKFNWEKKGEERDLRFEHLKEIEGMKIDSREAIQGFEAKARSALQKARDKESLRRTIISIEAKILGERSKKDSWFNSKDGTVAADQLDSDIKTIKDKFGL